MTNNNFRNRDRISIGSLMTYTNSSLLFCTATPPFSVGNIVSNKSSIQYSIVEDYYKKK